MLTDVASTQRELAVANRNLRQLLLFTLKLDNIEDYLRKVSVTQCMHFFFFLYIRRNLKPGTKRFYIQGCIAMGNNFLPMAHSPKSLLWFIYIRIHPEFKQS